MISPQVTISFSIGLSFALRMKTLQTDSCFQRIEFLSSQVSFLMRKPLILMKVQSFFLEVFATAILEDLGVFFPGFLLILEDLKSIFRALFMSLFKILILGYRIWLVLK
jgi:hypothetical protein